MPSLLHFSTFSHYDISLVPHVLHVSYHNINFTDAFHSTLNIFYSLNLSSHFMCHFLRDAFNNQEEQVKSLYYRQCHSYIFKFYVCLFYSYLFLSLSSPRGLEYYLVICRKLLSILKELLAHMISIYTSRLTKIIDDPGI